MKEPEGATLNEWELAWNAAVEKQANSQGGFCGYCGEACKPFVKGLPKELRDEACEFNGEHPNCGDHDLKRIEGNVTALWECSKCGWMEE